MNIVEGICGEIADASNSAIRRSLDLFGICNAQRSQSCKAGKLRLPAEAGKTIHVEERTIVSVTDCRGLKTPACAFAAMRDAAQAQTRSMRVRVRACAAACGARLSSAEACDALPTD